MANKVRVAVTGAAGQIGYSLLFRIASGELFGPDVQVELNLVEIPQGLKAAEGTAMELDDGAFTNLAAVNCFDNPEKGFDGVHWALLVGSLPRGPGMERADLLSKNGEIFLGQGRALAKADSEARVVVVGNPCNTNAFIAKMNCPELPVERFSAMTALDENRAKAQLAQKSGVAVSQVKNMIIWGNHSPTMYPDFENAQIDGRSAADVIKDRDWLEKTFIPVVQKRGAAIIEARGKSSAASAASACIDHVKRMITPTTPGDCFSAAVMSDGDAYGVPKGLMFSFPLRTDGNGGYEIVRNLPISDFAKAKLKTTTEELESEREMVKHLLP